MFNNVALGISLAFNAVLACVFCLIQKAIADHFKLERRNKIRLANTVEMLNADAKKKKETREIKNFEASDTCVNINDVDHASV